MKTVRVLCFTNAPVTVVAGPNTNAGKNEFTVVTRLALSVAQFGIVADSVITCAPFTFITPVPGFTFPVGQSLCTNIVRCFEVGVTLTKWGFCQKVIGTESPDTWVTNVRVIV